MRSKSLLIKNIDTMVTCDAEDRILTDVCIFMRDGRIERIFPAGGADLPEADEVIEAKDYLAPDGTIEGDLPFLCVVDPSADENADYCVSTDGGLVTIKYPELEPTDPGYEAVKSYVAEKYNAFFAAAASGSGLSEIGDVDSLGCMEADDFARGGDKSRQFGWIVNVKTGLVVRKDLANDLLLREFVPIRLDALFCALGSCRRARFRRIGGRRRHRRFARRQGVGRRELLRLGHIKKRGRFLRPFVASLLDRRAFLER